MWEKNKLEYACACFHKSAQNGDSWSFTQWLIQQGSGCQVNDDLALSIAVLRDAMFGMCMLESLNMINNPCSRFHTWRVKICWQLRPCQQRTSLRWSAQLIAKPRHASFNKFWQWYDDNIDDSEVRVVVVMGSSIPEIQGNVCLMYKKTLIGWLKGVLNSFAWAVFCFFSSSDKWYLLFFTFCETAAG